MPDDERPKRRLGDETKERIADLAAGWSLDGSESPPPPATKSAPGGPPAPTSKPAGSSVAAPIAAPKPTKAPTLPPPLETRATSRTSPPPPPGAPRRAVLDALVEEAPSTPQRTLIDDFLDDAPSPPQRRTLDDILDEPPSTPQRRPFDDSLLDAPDDAQPRHNTPATSAAFGLPHRKGLDEALAAVTGPSRPPPPRAKPPTAPPPLPTVTKSGVHRPGGAPSAALSLEAALETPAPVIDVRGSTAAREDATTIDPQILGSERDDATTIAPPDVTDPAPADKRRSTTKLVPSAALRRKRGLAGDVTYVFTALFGIRSGRKELAELEHRQSLRQTSRRRHLITLGRTAIITESLTHPALVKAREHLRTLEDARTQQASAVTAAEAEIEHARKNRETKAKQVASQLAAIDLELAEVTEKLEPLEKDAVVARKKAQALRESLQRVDKKLADTEARAASAKASPQDKSIILADLATLKADRQSVQRDEPMIASELDALNPRIASLEAQRAELTKKRAALEKAETEDQRRTFEQLEAIGAKRKVVERATAEAEAARDNALFELGEQLYVERPKVFAAQLAPIDQIDLDVGETERRAMELREILSNIDKAKFARGFAVVFAALAVVVALLLWLVS